MWASIGFTRKREYPPAEGTFNIASRGRVEPQGFAPTIVPSASFAVDAVARFEPLGEIPPVPSKAIVNDVSMSHTTDSSGGPRDGFITDVADEVDHTASFVQPPDIDTVRYQEAEDVGFTTGLSEQVNPADPVTWTNQKDGVTRYYRVRAENGSGAGEWSDVDSIKHIEDPPGAPQNLATDSLSSSSVRLQWDAPISGGSVQSYRLVDNQTNVGPDTSPGAITGLDEGSGHSVAVFAVGPDNQAGPLTSHVGQAVRHATPGLSGCLDAGTFHVLEIFDSASFRAQNNTVVAVYRDGALYDTLPDGDQNYQPSHQSGSWHVVSSGGAASTPLNGSVAIPNSDDSATVTMPFTGAC